MKLFDKVVFIGDYFDSKEGIYIHRFDQIVTNTTDHIPFIKAGLNDSFTITCISEKDIEAAMNYYKALERSTDPRVLFEILSEAPIFEHYHKPTDTFG